MQMLATALLAVFTIGYLVLAGADLGIGMMLPRLGRDAARRRTVIATFGPFFLANEVWLVAVAGILAGAFPGLEDDLLYENRAFLVALLFGWIVRDAGLWWRGRVDRAGWRAFCDGLIVAGSWTLALSLGAVLGRVTAGSAGALFAPVYAALLAVHGTGFARWRLTGTPLGRTLYPVTGLLLAGLAAAAGSALDLDAAVAGPSTVKVVALFVTALLPFLLAAQGLTWWAFRGRVQGPGYL